MVWYMDTRIYMEIYMYMEKEIIIKILLTFLNTKLLKSNLKKIYELNFKFTNSL